MTTYNYIYEEFKDKITDADLLLLSENLQDEILHALLKKAIYKVNRIVGQFYNLYETTIEVIKVQVTDEDGVGLVDQSGNPIYDTRYVESFLDDIPYEVVDLLTEWMTIYWLQPYVNNLENLRNNISTKDFSVFSPANLLEKIGDRYDIARKHVRGMTNEYSFIMNQLEGMKS